MTNLKKNLLKKNIPQPLDLHISNFKNNKIYWNKGKIRIFFYGMREESFLKDEEFLKNTDKITINFSNNKNDKQVFGVSKGEFINLS